MREYVDTDEELWSDYECSLRAKAILSHMKDPSEYIKINSVVIDYANTPLLPAEMITVSLPNENVAGNFHSKRRIPCKGKRRAEITIPLGREKSLLADYVYALRSKVNHVKRYKVARNYNPLAYGLLWSTY